MSEKRAISVMIVDDHPIVRDGLQGILASNPDFEVVWAGGERGRSREAGSGTAG